MSRAEVKPCPVCDADDWSLDYDWNGEDEVPVIRCQRCEWPPMYPVTVEEWRDSADNPMNDAACA